MVVDCVLEWAVLAISPTRVNDHATALLALAQEMPTVPCNDGLACTLTDLCDGQGNCVGRTSPCAMTDVCRMCSESRNASSGFVCASPAGTPCANNLFCDGPVDTCNGFGECRGNGSPCPACMTLCNEAARTCPCPLITTGFGPTTADSNTGTASLGSTTTASMTLIAMLLAFVALKQ